MCLRDRNDLGTPICHYWRMCRARGSLLNFGFQAVTQLASVRVLIVDDFPEWRRYVHAELQANPEFLVVGEAHDGLDAIAKSQELHPDVVLLDIGLPKLNGIEAARRLCMILPETKILFVSAELSPGVIRKALGAGPCIRGYVLKSDACRDLLPAMQSIMEAKD